KFCKGYRKQGHNEVECRKKKSLNQSKVEDGKFSPRDPVNDTVGAQKEIADLRKGKNIQGTGKERNQILEFGNQTRKHPDTFQLRKGMQKQGVWKVSTEQKEASKIGNNVERRSNNALQKDMVNIVDNILESTPIVLEIGEHSGNDMETTNLQNPVLIESSQSKKLPYVERPVADDGETLDENPRELLELAKFMLSKEGLCQLED
ncbi:unnamed protein product, partial [Ilex paraguariensis]